MTLLERFNNLIGSEDEPQQRQPKAKKSKPRNPHRISTRNSPCVCGCASSRHSNKSGCSECDFCTQFQTDEEALTKLVEKEQRKKLSKTERFLTRAMEMFGGEEEETPEQRRLRIQEELRHHQQFQGIRGIELFQNPWPWR